MISQMTQSVHSASPLSTSDDGQDEMQRTSSNTSSPNSGWKAVGSPPRGPGTRPSLTQTSNITSKSADHIPLDHTFGRLQDYAFPPVRKNSASAAAAVAPPPWAPVSLPTLSSSVSSPTAAGAASVAASFFQPQERRQSLVSDYPDIASVPMLPEVSTEPFFREYRSMSYSVEHDDYFNRGIPQHLMTMCEEENGDDLLSKALDDELLAAAQLRARSKSSAAAFDIWHPNHPSSDDAQSWRMAQLANQRRSSVTAPQSYLSSLYTAPYLSAGDQDRLNAVRRFSLSPIPDSTNSRLHTAASAAAPIDGSTLAFLNQRRHSLATPSPGKFFTTQNMDDIVDVLRNLKMDEEASKAEYDLPVLFPPEAMGKGVNLDDIPEDSLFYVVEFKRGRSDMYFSHAGNIANRPVRGDYVIVEGDRGHDLGKVTLENVGRQQLLGTLQQQQQHSDDDGFTKKKEVYVKRILRIARSNEVALTMTKNQDESKALMVCQSKVKQRKMPMQIVDAEYQWDRRKLTFYFVADRRVDFRDLVRDLFKLYKTRIWMCAVNTT